MTPYRYLSTLLDRNGIGEYRSRGIFLRAAVWVKQNRNIDALQILQNIYDNPVLKNDKGNALLKKGEIYQKMGYYKEGIQQNQKILSSLGYSNFYQTAWFNLGELYAHSGEIENAANAFEKVFTTGEDLQRIIMAHKQLGKLKMGQKKFKDALVGLNKAEQKMSDDADRIEITLLRIECLDKLNQITQAVSECEKLSMYTSVSEIHQKQCHFILADLYARSGRAFESIKIYNRILNTHELSDLIRSMVHFRIGKIYLHDLNQRDEAFIALRNIWLNHPNTPIAPEAYFVYAQALEKSKRFQNALQYYDRIITQYKESSWAKKALKRIAQIEHIIPTDNSDYLLALLEKSISQGHDADDLYYLAVTLGRDFKRFRQSEKLFQRYLTENSESTKKDSIQYWLSQNYFGISISENNPAYLDTALITLNQIPLDSLNSSLDQEILKKTVSWTQSISPQKRYEIFRDLSRENAYRQSKDLLFNWGVTALELDSLQKAQELLDEIPENISDDLRNSEILFYKGKTAFLKKEYEKADALLTKYKTDFSKRNYQSDALFYLAQIRQMGGDELGAIKELEEIVMKYPYAEPAKKAIEMLGELYLSTKSYANACQLYQAGIVEDSLNTWSAGVHLKEKKSSNRDKLLIGLARTREVQNRLKEAKDLYLTFRKEYPEQSNQMSAFIALSRIAEKENDTQLAADYLQRCQRINPSDSISGFLGDFYSRLNQHEKAIASYEEAGRLTQDLEKKAQYDFGIILNLIQQGKIPQTEVRMNVFTKSYKKSDMINEYEAEYFLNKGIAHIDKKDFQLALDALEEVRNKSKRSSFVPQAELEIGRVYLITNKIEDALKILTELPKKYPDDPILAKVYLNLGDHYFRSQQYQNAISAFKKVVENYPDSDVTQLAIRYLIRVYDSVRLWDAAMALTRRYLTTYPLADDVLQKHIQIGIFYMNLKEYNRAVEIFRDVKKSADSETEAEVQYWIGKCYYSLGQFQQAIFEFLKVKYISKPTKLPWATTALYEAGLAYLRLEKRVEARKIFEKIVQSEGAASDLGRIARKKIDEIESQPTQIKDSL